MSGKPRKLSIDASLGDEELDRRQAELKAWLERELQGGTSLNARGTTLAVLVGATIALVAGFASTWLDPKWGLSDQIEVLLTVLLAIALLALGLSGLFALRAVWPLSEWRGQLEEIVSTLAGKAEADQPAQGRRYAQLILETLELQRARNERKARLMRISLALLVAGVGAVLIQALVFTIAAQSSEPPCDRCGEVSVVAPDGTSGPPPDDGAQDSTPEGIERLDAVARRFAPVVWIHGKEKFGPVTVEEFLEHSELTWRTASRFSRDHDLAGRGALDPARLGSGCAALAAGCYRRDRFTATDLTRPHHGSPSRPLDLVREEGFYLDPDDPVRRGEIGSPAQAPIYYEARTGETTRIAYWFFFGFSRPNKTLMGVNTAALFSHEGDWENIEVVVGPGGRPRAVRYFGHGDPRRFAWEAICKIVDGGEECGTATPGRPVVYSALYSHASYASAAEKRSEETKVCAKNRLKWPCSHDFRNQGFLWDPLASEGGLHDVRAQPWYGFGGAWGSAGSKADTTGPLGPSQYKLPSDPEPGELESVVPEQPPGA